MDSSKKSMSKLGRFSLAALVTLLVLAIGWTVAERRLGLKVEPQMLRQGLFGLIVALSLLAGWLAARLGAGKAAKVVGEVPVEIPASIDPERLSRLTRAAKAQESGENLPELLTESATDDVPQDVAQAIELARHRPIVFRQHFPPTGAAGLSYFGGLPTGPADFSWPRHSFAGGERALTFLMQWDCRELAAQDATGLLPRDGVLYFFADLRWEDMDGCRFIHLAGDPSGWGPIDPPADLPALYGDQTAWMVRYCSRHVPADQQDCPVILPNWPFTPLAFDFTEHFEADQFWTEQGSAEQLIKVQNSLGDPPVGYHPNKPGQSNAPRPFPGFPHDWAAVRIACAAVLDKLNGAQARLPDGLGKLDQTVREARIAEIKAEAAELYGFAVSHPIHGQVPTDLSDQIWEWLAPLNGLYYPSQLATEAANTSLGLGSDAVAAIPAEVRDQVWSRHALGLSYMREEYAHEYIKRCGEGIDRSEAERRYDEEKAAGTLSMVRQVFAPTPSHMFGPASFVQGDAEEFVSDHLLLLEITSNSAIGIELGDGVVQYLIRPADLEAGRFDAIKVVASSY